MTIYVVPARSVFFLYGIGSIIGRERFVEGLNLRAPEAFKI
jgi:hypothetical protein